MCCTVSCTFPAKSPRWSVSVPRSAAAPQSLQQPPLLMQMMKRLRRQFPLFSSSTCWLPCFSRPRRAARIFHHKRRSLRNFRRNCCQRYFFRDRCRIHLGFLYQLGTQTLDKAVTVKLTRTLAIIPITLVLAFVRTREKPVPRAKSRV